MTLVMTRRQALSAGIGAAAAASGLVVSRGPAHAAVEETNAAILDFTGGVEPTLGRVMLELPEIAENGNTVPMDVTVDSPMTADDHVAALLVVADGNPNPGVATFRFTPMSGRAHANTRIRLAGTQTITAVAKMNDGSVFMDRREVTVTVAGCTG